MYALVCKIQNRKDVNGNELGYNVVHVSEDQFDVTGDFFWTEINEANYFEFGNLYYANGGIHEYFIPVEETIISNESGSVEATNTPEANSTITDGDLL